MENGYKKEEMKMINETHKILNKPNLKITATCVRVPVLNSHSESINVEFEKEFKINDIYDVLKNQKGVKIINDRQNNIYQLATNASGKEDILVGRIRRDESIENGLNFWCVADNIRKGAANNTVQIMKKIIEKDV